MHATDSTTQAATANVKPEHGSAHESPPTFVSTASRSLIMYSAALHACSCIPHIHLCLAQTHQLDIWAACFFLAIFAYLSFFLRVWLFCRFCRRQGAHVCCAHIPVFAHAVGGFELYNHLFCTLRYALSVCLCGGMDGWDVVVWRCGEQSLPEKKQRGSYGISEGGVFLVPIWPLCGILRFYDCDSRAFSLRLSFVEDVMGGVEFGGGTGLDWMDLDSQPFLRGSNDVPQHSFLLSFKGVVQSMLTVRESVMNVSR